MARAERGWETRAGQGKGAMGREMQGIARGVDRRALQGRLSKEYCDSASEVSHVACHRSRVLSDYLLCLCVVHGAIDRATRGAIDRATHGAIDRATHGAIDRATTEPSIAHVVRLLIVCMFCPPCHRLRHARCHRSRATQRWHARHARHGRHATTRHGHDRGFQGGVDRRALRGRLSK